MLILVLLAYLLVNNIRARTCPSPKQPMLPTVTPKPNDKMVEFTVFKGSKSGSIVESKTTKNIGPHDVLLKVTHSGLCFTDVHFKHSDIVLGHEGVGVVLETGPEVTLFEKYVFR
jgi:cobalamin biosynthesis protein CbiD